MMENATEQPYKIGYGKPPIEGRFRTGESGNLKGRPKTTQFEAVLAKALDANLNSPVKVKIGKRTENFSRSQLAIRTMVETAATGNKRAIRKLIRLRTLVEEEASIEPLVIKMDRQTISAIGEEFVEAAIERMRADKKTREGNARKRKPTGIKQLIDTELLRRVKVTKEGRPTRLTLLEVIVMQLSNASINGDADALPLLLKLKSMVKKKDSPAFVLEFQE